MDDTGQPCAHVGTKEHNNQNVKITSTTMDASQVVTTKNLSPAHLAMVGQNKAISSSLDKVEESNKQVIPEPLLYRTRSEKMSFKNKKEVEKLNLSDVVSRRQSEDIIHTPTELLKIKSPQKSEFEQRPILPDFQEQYCKNQPEIEKSIIYKVEVAIGFLKFFCS